MEDFHEDEEAEPQVELFKNLWLEAEAALCSLNYRARYDRVKFEMERFKSQNANGELLFLEHTFIKAFL